MPSTANSRPTVPAMNGAPESSQPAKAFTSPGFGSKTSGTLSTTLRLGPGSTGRPRRLSVRRLAVGLLRPVGWLPVGVRVRRLPLPVGRRRVLRRLRLRAAVVRACSQGEGEQKEQETRRFHLLSLFLPSDLPIFLLSLLTTTRSPAPHPRRAPSGRARTRGRPGSDPRGWGPSPSRSPRATRAAPAPLP